LNNMREKGYSILDTHYSKSSIKYRASRIEKIGFSIIELLVVIAIIAVILAILMPGLGKARGLAKQIRCAANLKQIDAAMHAYLSSNDDVYPRPDVNDPLQKKQPTDPSIWLWMGRGWRGFLAPHLGGNIDANNPSVLLCPSDKVAPVMWESTSYAYSMAFYHSPEQIDDTTSSFNTSPAISQNPVNVANPSGKIIIGEWLSNHWLTENENNLGWFFKKGRRNFLFADGQIRFIDANDIRAANDGNPNPNLTKHGIKGTDWPK
jgi:prepilin-type N-terminal cleavage/methylation domain-containing protein/prepilin-type processing-associated H-X9-DG protein